VKPGVPPGFLRQSRSQTRRHASDHGDPKPDFAQTTLVDSLINIFLFF
jgi:hypothetical protein